MKIDLVFITIICLFLVWSWMTSDNKNKPKTVEKMADTGITNDIKDAVKQVYNADVQAIRNLSEVATKLQAGGLNVPGVLNIGQAAKVTFGSNEGASLQLENPLKTQTGQTKNWVLWNMTGKDYGNKLSFWRYNGDGTNAGPAMDIYDDGRVSLNGPTNINGTTNINGPTNIAQTAKVTLGSNEGASLQLENPLKDKAGQTKIWTLWNMTGGYGNKLSFWRYNGDGTNAGPAMDIYDDGRVSLNGPTNISGNTLINGATTINGPLYKSGEIQYMGRGGGTGGNSEFNIMCPDGKIMVGLNMRTGGVVDSVGPICK